MHTRTPSRPPAPAEPERFAGPARGFAAQAKRIAPGDEGPPAHDFASVGVHAPPSPAASGRALPDGLRRRMEGALGASFGDVRVHEDGHAPAIGALAYTRGSHVHLAPGLYRPWSASGRRLLGHELAHVVHQRERVVRPTRRMAGTPVNQDPALERAADRGGARAAEASSTPSAPVAANAPGPAAPDAGSGVAQPLAPLAIAGLAVGGAALLGYGAYKAYGAFRRWRARRAYGQLPADEPADLEAGNGAAPNQHAPPQPLLNAPALLPPQQQQQQLPQLQQQQQQQQQQQLPQLQQQAPAGPQITHVSGADDGYRQTWTHPHTGAHQYLVSSGHGYRREHKPGGPDITQHAPREEIEEAILHHLAPDLHTLPMRKGGRRRVDVRGRDVGYSYNRIDDDKTGIGTYFLH